jgi:hypothetical protein
VHAFRLPHALHIRRQFSESSGISNTLLSLGFSILLLLRLILLGFPMLISWGVGDRVEVPDLSVSGDTLDLWK